MSVKLKAGLRLTPKARTVLARKGLPVSEHGLKRLHELTAFNVVEYKFRTKNAFDGHALPRIILEVSEKMQYPHAKLAGKLLPFTKNPELARDPGAVPALKSIQARRKSGDNYFLPDDLSLEVKKKIDKVSELLNSSQKMGLDQKMTKRLVHDLVNDVRRERPDLKFSQLTAHLRQRIRRNRRGILTPDKLVRYFKDPGPWTAKQAMKHWNYLHRLKKYKLKPAPTIMELDRLGNEKLASTIEFLLGKARNGTLSLKKIENTAKSLNMNPSDLMHVLKDHAEHLKLDEGLKNVKELSKRTFQREKELEEKQEKALEEKRLQKKRQELEQAQKRQELELNKKRVQVKRAEESVFRELEKKALTPSEQLRVISKTLELDSNAQLAALNALLERPDLHLRARAKALTLIEGRPPSVSFEELRERGKGWVKDPKPRFSYLPEEEREKRIEEYRKEMSEKVKRFWARKRQEALKEEE